MKFYLGLFVWVLIAAALAFGVVYLTTHGTVFSALPLAIGLLAFVGGFVKFGCLNH